jgi:hypothetical protein
VATRSRPGGHASRHRPTGRVLVFDIVFIGAIVLLIALVALIARGVEKL